MRLSVNTITPESLEIGLSSRNFQGVVERADQSENGHRVRGGDLTSVF